MLVSIDSLRADHLGCYGYPAPTSPTIDHLAREGARFAHAISTTSWTLPAHAALFTGLNDSAHGVTDLTARLAPAFTTLAERLHDAGYHTAGFYAGPLLHPTFGLDQGFDYYQSCMSGPVDGGEGVRDPGGAPHDLSHRDITGPRTIQRVAQWLGNAGPAPIFLFVQLWDVHYDYIPPAGYVEMFDPDYQGTLTGDEFTGNRARYLQLPARDRQHLVALYDGEIRFTDDTLAGVLAELGKHRGARDTLLVVTADHGEEFFEHGGTGHQRTLFDEVIHVPLVVRWPGKLAPGRVIDDEVRLIDIMPTVLDLVGLQPPAEVQGRSIAPLLRGESLPEQPAMSELLIGDWNYRTLRTNRWKVHQHQGIHWSAYYDLASDPSEAKPILDLPPEGVAAMADLGRRVEASRAIHVAVTGGKAAEPVAIAPELEDHLRGLGYIGQ